MINLFWFDLLFSMVFEHSFILFVANCCERKANISIRMHSNRISFIILSCALLKSSFMSFTMASELFVYQTRPPTFWTKCYPLASVCKANLSSKDAFFFQFCWIECVCECVREWQQWPSKNCIGFCCLHWKRSNRYMASWKTDKKKTIESCSTLWLQSTIYANNRISV